MAYLIQNPQDPQPKIHQLQNGLNTIGRDLKNNVRIEDRSLSRHHAEIIVAKERVLLKDLGSLNRTFVNDREIKQCHLQDGDLVRCGRVICKFVQTTLPESDSNISILGRFAPDLSQIRLQDLVEGDDSQNPGTIVKLKHKDNNQQALDKLKILLAVSKELSSPEEPDKLLGKILDLMFEIINIDRAAILIVNPRTFKLEPKAYKFRPGIAKEKQFYSKTITNFVQHFGEAIITADARQDRRFESSLSILLHAIQASICVPLKPRDKVIGVLYADNLSIPDLYDKEDLEFITALVNQAAIAFDNAQLYKQLKSEAVMRTKLERFFPDSVRKKLKEGSRLEIVETEVTLLFADISGYTAMSSRMEPKQIITMLNEYFTVMVEQIIFPYEGTLDKYMGDGLLAFWGAPYQREDDAKRAVKAAIEMQKAVIRLNQDWQQRGMEQIAIHIGLNTGKVAAGNIGSKKLIQYTTIGDTTNVCSRICSVAKSGEILISQSTLLQLKGERTIPVIKMLPVKVKGKQEPLQLYKVVWNK